MMRPLMHMGSLGSKCRRFVSQDGNGSIQAPYGEILRNALRQSFRLVPASLLLLTGPSPLPGPACPACPAGTVGTLPPYAMQARSIYLACTSRLSTVLPRYEEDTAHGGQSKVFLGWACPIYFSEVARHRNAPLSWPGGMRSIRIASLGLSLKHLGTLAEGVRRSMEGNPG